MSALPKQEQLVRLLELCVDDPELFFVEVLRVTGLRRWQERVCAEIKARLKAGDFRLAVHIRSCHGAGKTWFVGGLLLWFESTRPQARGLTTAPTWKQVEETLWTEIASLYNGSLLRGHFGRLLSTRLDVQDVWFASGVSSDHMENIEGQHSPTAAIRIVDEAKAVPAEVFDATKGIFTSPEILDVWISTPSIQSGEFYKRDVSNDQSVIRIVVDVDELITDPFIPEIDRAAFAAWKAECARDWGLTSPEYLSRVMAQYVDQAEGSLFPASWIDRAMAETFQLQGKVTAALDAAGSVDGDESALAIAVQEKDGDRVQVRSIESWHERDTMISKGRALAGARGALATLLRIDAIGLGKGVADAARGNGIPVEEYRASDKPMDGVRFSNRKAEDAWTVRMQLERGVARWPVSQKLRTQAAAMKFEITQAGKIKIIDPADSPDLVDALIIALAAPHVAGAGFLDWMKTRLQEDDENAIDAEAALVASGL